MSFDRPFSAITRTGLALLLVAAGHPLLASDADEERVRVEKVHKVIVDCDEDSAEDCEREIRIESHGDGSHFMHFGDHEMTWVKGPGHAAHYSFGPSFLGEGGFLGVQLTDLTAELRAHFGVATDQGVMVAKVVDDSAAFRAGLQAGDIITRIDGESVASSGDLSRAIRSRSEGDVINLEIWRDGLAETISATLDANDRLAGMHRRIMIDCDENDEDCGAVFVGLSHGAMAVDCPEGEECEIKVDCDDGECACTMNGESIDCEELHSTYRFGD